MEPTRIEVENFDNRPGTFRIENLAGIASADKTLTVRYRSDGGPSEGEPISTRTTYTGPDGVFDVRLGTFDESDGNSRIVARIGGVEVADFILNQTRAAADREPTPPSNGNSPAGLPSKTATTSRSPSSATMTNLSGWTMWTSCPSR